MLLGKKLNFTFTMRIFILSLFVFFSALFVNAQAPSDSSRAKLKKVIERVTSANVSKYGTKDNLGQTMDCAKIITNPQGGFIAVYHHYISGTPKVFIATSTDFLNWTMIKQIANQASQPAIIAASDSGYVMAWEQEPNNHLKICYYTNLNNLFNGIALKTYDVARSLSTCAEGTPNIYSASSTYVDIGFHYYQSCNVDRQARGVLTNFNSWFCGPLGNFDNALLHWGVAGNIGDRDAIHYDIYDLGVIEGQFIKNDFGSWRSFIYDYQTGNAEQLNIVTASGSTAFANPTITRTLINGKDALIMTMFITTEGAAPGEVGELIYYKILDTLSTDINQNIAENSEISLFPNPAQNQITVSDSKSTINEITIIDMLGRVVLQNNECFVGSKTIDVSGLQNGTYFCLINDKQFTSQKRKKFSINR